MIDLQMTVDLSLMPALGRQEADALVAANNLEREPDKSMPKYFLLNSTQGDFVATVECSPPSEHFPRGRCAGKLVASVGVSEQS